MPPRDKQVQVTICSLDACMIILPIPWLSSTAKLQLLCNVVITDNTLSTDDGKRGTLAAGAARTHTSSAGQMVRQRLSALIRGYEACDPVVSDASSKMKAPAALRGRGRGLSHSDAFATGVGRGVGSCQETETVGCRCGLKACRCAGRFSSATKTRHALDAHARLAGGRGAREVAAGRAQGAGGAREAGARRLSLGRGLSEERSDERRRVEAAERERVLRWLMQEVSSRAPCAARTRHKAA